MEGTTSNTPLREFRWYRVQDWANDELKAGRSPEPYFGDVCRETYSRKSSIPFESSEFRDRHGRFKPVLATKSPNKGADPFRSLIGLAKQQVIPSRAGKTTS